MQREKGEEEMQRKKEEEEMQRAKDEEKGEEEKKEDEEEKKDDEKKDDNVDVITDSAEKPDADQVEADGDAKAETEEADVVEEEVKVALEVPDCVDNFASLVEAKIVNYEFSEGAEKWRQAEGAEPPFFENVDRLYKLANALSYLSRSEPNYADSLNRVGSVLHKAMLFTEGEFKSILEDITTADPNSDAYKVKQDSVEGSANETESSSNELEFPGYTAEQISNLSKLAHAMISAGYDTECCQIYFILRRNIFEESLIRKLGFEKSSIDEVLKMNWETLGREIGTWITTFKQCAKVNFPGELKLAQSVFTNHKLISDSLYANLSKGVLMQLLNFAEAVAMTKRSAEKLFKVLDMYETLRDIIPVLDELFPEDCVDEIKSEALSAKSRLGEAATSIFCELENSIKSDTNRTPVPGGAVHPLTRYTINYLKYACEYKNTLEQVFREHYKVERADSTSAPDYQVPSHIDAERARESPFIVQLVKVMDLLDSYIESKSKLYKDISLSYIFLMNNGRYILQRIRADINELMGDSWCRKRSSELRSYHKNYQRETWGKVLQCLSQEGLNVNGKVPKPVLKERFKNFNALFDEIHRTQSAWIVSDEQLQSELQVSISAVVIPAYRAFLGRFNQHFTPGRQTEKYVKYQPEDIESCLDELFNGNPNAGLGKKKP
uniref:Exocyst subunit Exo70 family protein n=1 Tax=Kalanchoe fedtschenkoi TaxID=63787 RepID=A0A7N1A5D3_KALFE